MKFASIDPNAFLPSDDLVIDPEVDPQEAGSEGGAADGKLISDAERESAPDEEDVMGYLGDPDADHAPKIVVDDRPAIERTQELFKRMHPSRRVLLGILKAVKEPVAPEAIAEVVAQLKAANRSVYDSFALCNLLERAGAIEAVKGEAQQPQVVVVDGVECLAPAEEVEVKYVITEAGQAMLDADKPMERFNAMMEKEAVYAPIFLAILQACEDEGGKTAKELGALVDSDPLLQNPRYWAARFFNLLGECDALAWDGTWKTTELGRDAIAILQA